MPRQTAFGYLGQERIGVKLLDIEHTCTAPFAREQHIRARHGRHAGGVTNALCASLFVRGFVAAVVVNVVGFLLAVLLSGKDTANVG